MNIALIIPAAGSGSRYSASGALRSKLDEDLGGRTVLQRTIENFVNHAEVGPLIKVVIVAGPADAEEFTEFKTRHGDRLGLMGATLCRGGKDFRYQSVKAALDCLLALPAANSCTHIVVHDAARPCTSQELIQRMVDAAAKHPAVIPAVDIADTIKRVEFDSADAAAEDEDPLARILGAKPKSEPPRIVKETVSRENLVLVQTPQIFTLELFTRAYAQKDLGSTDDAGLVERLGQSVRIVSGESSNLKITRAADLTLARAILKAPPPSQREAHKRF